MTNISSSSSFFINISFIQQQEQRYKLRIRELGTSIIDPSGEIMPIIQIQWENECLLISKKLKYFRPYQPWTKLRFDQYFLFSLILTFFFYFFLSVRLKLFKPLQTYFYSISIVEINKLLIFVPEQRYLLPLQESSN